MSMYVVVAANIHQVFAGDTDEDPHGANIARLSTTTDHHVQRRTSLVLLWT